MPARPRYPIPDFFRDVLNARSLMDAYLAGPPYQQNDTIGSLCVTRAKLETTRQKRLNQILDLLQKSV